LDRSSSTITCWHGARTPDHLRPVAAGQQERRLPRGAEELGHRPVRIVVGYHRYDTEAEVLLLNKIWALQSKLTNYFYPQQNSYPKSAGRQGDQQIRPPRTAAPKPTPKVADHGKALLADTYTTINPAAVQRRIQALAGELLTLTTSNAGPKTKAPVTAPIPRASLDESTNRGFARILT
jgi:hypothetical protein